MAKSERNEQVVTTNLVQINLSLSESEALALAVALSCVGGSPGYSARAHTDDILGALRKAGIHWTEAVQLSSFRHTGSITFERWSEDDE